MIYRIQSYGNGRLSYISPGKKDLFWIESDRMSDDMECLRVLSLEDEPFPFFPEFETRIFRKFRIRQLDKGVRWIEESSVTENYPNGTILWYLLRIFIAVTDFGTGWMIFHTKR